MMRQERAPEAARLAKKMGAIAALKPGPMPALPEVPMSKVCAARQAFSRAHSRRSLFNGGSGGRSRKPSQTRRSSILSLVQRITNGVTPAELQRAISLGYDAYLEEQLDYLSIDDSAMQPRLANFPTLGMTPKELVDAYPVDTYIPFNDLKGATLVRAVHSKRQLFERMCEFWSDHFSIDHQKDPEWAFKPQDDINVTRQHALTSFPQILRASAHSSAMMFYLDNWLNFIGTAQENWARELMELHTLGVGGGYTEQDVKEVARAFTGWSLEFDDQLPTYLDFKFHDYLHDPSPGIVLGQPILGGIYQAAGDQVLNTLSSHPSTARFIATKMTRWLLTENPPEALIDVVAQTYMATGGDIKAMIRVILAEDNVRYAASPYRPKFKRPFHFLTSLLRGLDAEVYDPLVLVYYLGLMGHSPFDWPAPNGYPDTVKVWGKSLLPRWGIASSIMTNLVPGVQVSLADINNLLGDFNQPGLAGRISDQLLGKSLSPADKQAVEEFLAPRAPLVWPEVYEAIAFAASCPGNQWH